MIVIKYSKLGNISYVSHVDNMRVLQRSLNRAGIAVAMSQGFNPHPLTYCSQPLPVGVQSVAEYIAFQPAKVQKAQDITTVENVNTADNSQDTNSANKDMSSDANGDNVVDINQIVQDNNAVEKVDNINTANINSQGNSVKDSIISNDNGDNMVISHELLQDIAKAFDIATPDGIKVENVTNVLSNPNIAGRVVACDYECQCELSQDDSVRLEQFFAKNPNIIEIDKKGIPTPMDIAPLVLSAQVERGAVRMRLKTGNPTLRPDKLIDNINKTVLKDSKMYIVNTIRLNHLVDDNGGLITADELLIRMNQ